MTETVKAHGAEISMERYHDNSATIKIVRYMTSLSIPLEKADVDNFLAAVAREFDVTFTANPKPPKVGDVVDRETAFGLPQGSLVEADGIYPYYRAGARLVHRCGTHYEIEDFTERENFTIKYIGGNA